MYYFIPHLWRSRWRTLQLSQSLELKKLLPRKGWTYVLVFQCKHGSFIVLFYFFCTGLNNNSAIFLRNVLWVFNGELDFILQSIYSTSFLLAEPLKMRDILINLTLGDGRAVDDHHGVTIIALQGVRTNDSGVSLGYLEDHPKLQAFFAVVLTMSAAFGVFGNILIVLTVAMTKVSQWDGFKLFCSLKWKNNILSIVIFRHEWQNLSFSETLLETILRSLVV